MNLYLDFKENFINLTTFLLYAIQFSGLMCRLLVKQKTQIQSNNFNSYSKYMYRIKNKIKILFLTKFFKFSGGRTMLIEGTINLIFFLNPSANFVNEINNIFSFF